MIGYLKGEVAGIYDDKIILEVGGIGYNIYMPTSSLDLIDGIGTELKVYTYLCVREDALLLYGFLTMADLEFYRLLITVNGVGPKAALALLSFMNADELRFAILASDSKQISKAPGIGPKTASRIIIDLKDRIGDPVFDAKTVDTTASQEDTGAVSDAVNEAAQALSALGYSQTESYKAVRAVASADDDVETILKKALSVISQF